jgi:diguanylate cyclase (GGDEF)-like protein
MAPGPPPRMRVLVADDDEDILALVSFLLRGDGYEVLAARDGAEALGAAREQSPDLAVLDVMMPRVDGYEVTRRLRAAPAISSLPVLLLTAFATGEDVVRGFEAGADDYVRKPFSGDELRARVRALLERRRLLDRLVEQARTDGLTGLLNRRAWEEELHRELIRGGRYGSPMSLALLDLDRLKQLNDEHGHQAGDDLLRALAEAWKQRVRGVDVLARTGGDEFALLMPNCAPEQGLGVVRRVLAALPEGATCSCGLAAWEPGESAEALVARADAALYAAKREGRDHLVVAPPRLPESGVA